MKNRIPRKLKKRIIKCFGRGTYRGIMDGYLILTRTKDSNRVITKRTSKPFEDYPYHSGQQHPYLNFPRIILK